MTVHVSLDTGLACHVLMFVRSLFVIGLIRLLRIERPRPYPGQSGRC